MVSGAYEWSVPLLGTVLRWQHPGGKPPCDWFGINYYSRWGWGERWGERWRGLPACAGADRGA